MTILVIVVIALGNEKRSTVLGVSTSISERNCHYEVSLVMFIYQILFITLVINLFGRIQFLKSHMKFHQITIKKFSLINLKLWKISVVKTSIG